MFRNRMSKRILAFALCALLTAGMIPESILAAEAGESTEESAGISGNEAAQEPVSDNKTDPDTGELTPGDDDEGMTPSEEPSEIPEETVPEDTVSDNTPEETVSENDISEVISDNGISETVSENEAEEAAGAETYIYWEGKDISDSGILKFYTGTYNGTRVLYVNELVTEALGSQFSGGREGITCTGDLILVVDGTNRISMIEPSGGTPDKSFGLWVNGDLTIVGANENSSIEFIAGDGKTTSAGIFCHGLHMTGENISSLTVKNSKNTTKQLTNCSSSKVTVKATGKRSGGTSSDINEGSFGIMQDYGQTELLAGSIEATGGTAERLSVGMQFRRLGDKPNRIGGTMRVIGRGGTLTGRNGVTAGIVGARFDYDYKNGKDGMVGGNSLTMEGTPSVEAYGGTVLCASDSTIKTISYGFAVYELTVNGGTLKAVGGDANPSGGTPGRGCSTGLYCQKYTQSAGNVTVQGGMANTGTTVDCYSVGLNAMTYEQIGGTLDATAKDAWAYSKGIEAGSSHIKNATVTARSGIAVCRATDVGRGSYGATFGKFTADEGCILTATSGMRMNGGAGSAFTHSAGIRFGGAATVNSGATINGTGGEARFGDTSFPGGVVFNVYDQSPGNTYGIYAEDALTVNGGTVRGTGGNVVTEDSTKSSLNVADSYGIYVKGTATFSDGSVTGTGGTTWYAQNTTTAGEDSYGIYTADIPVFGGAVITATGGDAGIRNDTDRKVCKSYGLYCGKTGSLTLKYGSVTARGYTGAIKSPGTVTCTVPVLYAAEDYYGTGWTLQRTDTVNSSWKYAVLTAKEAVVDIADWTYGGTASTPSVYHLSRYGNGGVTVTKYTYAKAVKSGKNYTYNDMAQVPSEAGMYGIKATLSNGLTSAYTNFNIEPRNLSSATINFGTQKVYNGSLQLVEISSVVCGGKTLTKNTDYTITSGGRATNVFDTTLTITGKGNYTGTKSGIWSLQKATLKYTDFEGIVPGSTYDFVYDGTYKTVSTPYKDGVGAVTLFYLYKDGNQYKYYENRVKEPKTYYVYFDVAESRNYKAANKLTYGSADTSNPEYIVTIKKKPGEPVECVPTARVKIGQTVDLMPNIAGALGTPKFAIEENNTSGVCTVDENSGLFRAGNSTGTCRVSVTTSPSAYYSGWRAAATAYITVTVDNRESAALSVTQADTTYGTTLPDPVFTPSIASPEIKYTGLKRDGTKYEETSTKPTEAGNYTVTVTGESGDYSYSGSAAFKIDPKNIAGASFTFGAQDTYDGSVKAVKNLSVKDGTKDLTTSDYDIISGETAIDVAEQQVTIEGKGNYTGTATSAAKWKLQRMTPAVGDFIITPPSARAYTGEATDPVELPELKNGGSGCGDFTIYYTGTSGTSYDKSETPPTDAGTYAVTFDVAEGTNFSSATGLAYGTLTVNKVDFTGDKEVFSGGQINKETTLDLSGFANSGTLESVNVTVGSGYLSAAPTVSGKDLKFTFKSGTQVGSTAKVTVPVTGCRNYNNYTLTVTLTAEAEHTLEKVAAKAATCTMNGNKEYYYATDAEGLYYYDADGTQPAFWDDIIIPALGHDWGEWEVVREATTSAPGSRQRVCSRCGETETEEIPKLPLYYTVSFSLNGKAGTAPEAQSILEGNRAVKPSDPSVKGYKFLGWYTDSGYENAFDFNGVITSDLTLYARLVPEELPVYTVTFNANGHGSAPAAQKVEEGGLAGTPKDPVSEGWIFEGWYTDASCKTRYDFSDPVTKDVTLFARWEEDVPPGAFKIFYTESELKFDPYKGLTYNTGNEHYEWTYTGSALKPAITVTDHKGNVLTEGSDYTVKYTGNKDVSAKPAKVTVTGKGNYAGSRSLEFYILKADLAKAKAKKMLIIPDSFAVQKGKKISPVVIYQGVTLDPKKDYKLSNTGAIKEDTTVDIEGKGTFFTGKISGIPVKALSAEEIRNNTIKVSLSPEKHVYTGSAQELSDKELVVKAGSGTAPLAKGKDYKVIYSKNTDAGKAKVTVMALGSYIGNVSKTFTIEADTKSNITAALKEGMSTGYDPKGATPALNVKTDKTELTAGKDYKVAYSNNKAKGEADYRLTFIGNFKGHKPVTGKFTITEGAFASASVNSADLIYGKPNLYRSVPFVSIGGVSVGKKDYTVKYFDGTKELAATDKITLGGSETEKTITVKATGKNNYKAEDSAAFTYRVVKVSGNMINLSKAKIVGKDTKKGVKGQEYTGEYVTPEIDVLVKQGKTWVKTDPANYTVTYINNINKGKAVIMVTGKDGAAGSKTAKFTIKAKSMSKFN